MGFKIETSIKSCELRVFSILSTSIIMFVFLLYKSLGIPKFVVKKL